MTDPMTTYEAAVEEAEARQDEQIDEQRIAEAEGWLRDGWEVVRTMPSKLPIYSARAIMSNISTAVADVSQPPEEWVCKLSAAYDVLGLSGTLRALARFVEEEEHAHRVDR